VEKYKKPDKSDFDDETKLDITEGHRNLVLAMWQAFRDPISHELVDELKASGLYTEKDCLDALSLLSHLFRRLDDIEAVKTMTTPQPIVTYCQ
ncbi:MAG: TIGR02391 family protein, partial [Christensenellaceae bacterium]|nr:TIGR02391 family protein [Christensenellaceae bacterium]